MEATRPDPRFIAQFNILAEDPLLTSLLNKNENTARNTFIITSIAVAALTCVRYLYTRSYITLGIGAVVMLANLALRARAVKKAQRTDRRERDARIKQATEGIKEGLDYYRKRKQAEGIQVINALDVSKWGAEAEEKTQKALDQFEQVYDGNDRPLTDLLKDGAVAVELIGIGEDAETYRKILPIAQRFIYNHRIHYKLESLTKDAQAFCFGYPSGLVADKGYLDVSVAGNKAVGKAWVE